MNDAYFGRFFSLLQEGCKAGGSELGVGLTLFSLVASLRARTVIEIGRYKGFSGLALASGLKLLDEGWTDPDTMHSRPDMDWAKHEEQGVQRQLYSIDPFSYPDSEELWRKAGVDSYITRINQKSADARLDELPRPKLVFIDGDHGFEPCMSDIDKYGAHLLDGGFMVLHDYFGPFDKGANISRVKDVVAVVTKERYRSWVLIDTGYPSMVLIRKPDPRVNA